MISGIIIKVQVSAISRSRKLRLITLNETKTESNNCFIIHCFKENKDKRIMLKKRFDHLCHITVPVNLSLLLEIMHFVQIIH